jgi:hypothetical protein
MGVASIRVAGRCWAGGANRVADPAAVLLAKAGGVKRRSRKSGGDVASGR